MPEVHPLRALFLNAWVVPALSWLLSWSLPILLWLTPKIDRHPQWLIGGAVLWFLLGISFCSFIRQSRTAVILWLPLLVLPILGGLFLLAQTADAGGGGPSAAPLGGVAVLLGLIACGVCISAFLLALVLRPKVILGHMLGISVANTLAILIALPMSYSISTGQNIVLTVLDKNSSPIAGARVVYEISGLDSSGSTFLAGSGGPLLTEADGSVVIPSRRMRYETQTFISKIGYRDVLMRIDMQHSEQDKQRGVSLSTRETRGISQMKIPSGDTLRLSIYLPSDSDRPDPTLRRITFRTVKSNDERPDRFLELKTGELSKDKPSDLELAVYGYYSDAKLVIKGLNNVEVLQVPSEFEVSDKLPAFDHLFRIAPVTGYQRETLIQHPGSPSSWIYVRDLSRQLHARISIDFRAGKESKDVRYTGEIHLTENGSRLLE